MNEPKVIDVFAVYGDSINVGKGILIGVYEEEKHANIAVVGRGKWLLIKNLYNLKLFCRFLEDFDV